MISYKYSLVPKGDGYSWELLYKTSEVNWTINSNRTFATRITAYNNLLKYSLKKKIKIIK